MNNIWSKFGHKNGSGTFQWSILITFGINIYSPPSVSSVPFLPSLTAKAKCEMGWGFHMWYVRGMGGEGSIYYDGVLGSFFSNIFVGLSKILNNQKSSFTKLSSILIQKDFPNMKSNFYFSSNVYRFKQGAKEKSIAAENNKIRTWEFHEKPSM